MASPFAVFRRNQRVLLATAGVLAIIAFVFLDPRLTGMLTGKTNNPVIVKTAYGDLHRAELSYLRTNRRIVENFLRQLVGESVRKKTDDPSTAMMLGQFRFGQVRDRVLGRLSSGDEPAAVETYVLAKKAEKMGVIVSDQQINDVILMATGDALSSADVRQIIAQSAGQSDTISPARMFDLIRTELMAGAVLHAFTAGLQAAPPAQRWEYYQRVHREATAEIAELNVVEFTPSAPQPSDAEVREYYEKYKNRLPSPTSPEPGFKQPTKAAFEYFKIELAPFLEAAKEQVTDEQIADYYELNKRTEFVAEPKQDKSPADDKQPTESTEETTANDEKGPTDAAPTDAAPTDSAPTDGGPDAPEANGDADNAGEQPPAAGDAPPTDSQPQVKPEGSVDNRARRSAAPIRLSSFLQDDPATDSPAATDKPADEAATEPASQPAADAAADEVLTDKLPSEKFVGKDVQYKPLDDVREEIRERLAKVAAKKERDAVLDVLRGEMKAYSTAWGRHQIPSTKAPKPDDLKFRELAEKHSVSAYKTELVSALDVDRQEGIYRSYTTRASGPVNFHQIGFIELAFDPKLALYRAEETTDVAPEDAAPDEKHIYLFWKTAQQPEKVPALDAIRADVVKAWKMVKARDIARKQAEAYAQTARKSDQPLADALRDEVVPVSKIGPFTWLTQGSAAGGTLRYSEVKGAEMAGEEFMKTLFGLPAGGVGVAMNQPQKKVFVIRLLEYTPSDTVLREQFGLERNMRDYYPLVQRDLAHYYETWLANVEKEAGVVWNTEFAEAPQPDDEM